MKIRCLVLAACAAIVCSANEPSSESVKAITKKVADWQIATFEGQGSYRALPSKEVDRRKWHHRQKYSTKNWNSGALFAGMYEWSEISGDPAYGDWLKQIGEKNQWELNNRGTKGIEHADGHAVGISYLQLAAKFEDPSMWAPTQKTFDEILALPNAADGHWTWVDALFMSPTVWAQLTALTGDARYLNYMDQQYRQTYNSLWNADDRLFWRDNGRKKKHEANGANEYWARGNGWAYGGLTFMLPYLPEDWEGRSFYVELFQDMSESLKRTQRSDGTWSMGMMGAEADYPSKDTSGSTFFVFGLARGVNLGILDRATYEPVIVKGWNALVDCVREDGLLGYVQGVGAGPGETFADYTELYGVGGFLAAGAEMFKFCGGSAVTQTELQSVALQEPTIFMKDGGWCWFQDPRTIIHNGKLIIGATSGVSGDIRVGVYDLKENKPLGEVVLHHDLQRDDHNDPAFYVRPDGRILAVYAKHALENIHYYCISDPDDYLKWSEPKLFVHDYDHPRGVTYMNLYAMEDEGLLYNFFRDGPTFKPWFITSDDDGDTWGNRTQFIDNDIKGHSRPYARYLKRDANTVAVSFTDAHPRFHGNSIYYADFRGGSFYRADGSKIKDLADGPLLNVEAERVFQGSDLHLTSKGVRKPKGYESVPYSGWTCAMAQDDQSNPHLGYSLYLNNDDIRYRMAFWNGKKWVDREVAHAGTSLYHSESSYSGLLALDPSDPRQVVISANVNPTTGESLQGTHELYAAQVRADDDIETIEWTQLTESSEGRNIRPLFVEGEGYKVLLWMKGRYTRNRSYNPDIAGFVLERPESVTTLY